MELAPKAAMEPKRRAVLEPRKLAAFVQME